MLDSKKRRRLRPKRQPIKLRPSPPALPKRRAQTVDQVITALGGAYAAARLTDRGATAVYNWRDRKRLAAETFLIISHELDRLGYVAPPALWGIRPARLTTSARRGK